jgi:hypothetical protein
MKYTVLWTPYAESKLAELWMQASSRQSVSEAADKIDEFLRQNPQR